jgi:hypothetical protein
MECTKGNWRKIKKPRLRALLRAYFNKIASVMQQTICWCPSFPIYTFSTLACSSRGWFLLLHIVAAKMTSQKKDTIVVSTMQFTANKRLLLPHLLSDLSLVAGETHVDVQAAPYTRAQQKTTPSAQRNLSKSLEKWRTHVESGCGGDVMRDCIVMRRFWSKLFQKLYGCKRVWEMRNWESAG